VQFNLTNAQSTLANTNGVTGASFNFTNNPSIAGNTEYAVRIQNQATSNTTDNAVAALLLLDNADTTTSGTTLVTDAIKITNSGGAGFTNFLNTDTLDISAAGVISGATGITSSGTVAFSGLSTNGFVKTTGGTGTLSVSSMVALGSEVSGTLGVGNGGTGAATLTSNGVLYGNGTGAVQATAAGTDAQFLVANVSGVPVFVTLSGDATLASTGALTIANDAVALGTDTTGNYVTSITNGSGISGGNGGSEGAALTLALGALTADWNQTGAFDITLNNASSELKILESAGATYYGILDAGDLSADRTLTMPDVSGIIATTNGGQTFTSATWNGTAIGAAYGGTGLDTSASTGIATVSSGTWSIASSLGVTLGGTGTTTQFTQGSIVFAGASGVYSQDNSNFFWDDTNNRLGIGTATPATSLHILGTSNALRLAYDATNYTTLSTESDGDISIASSNTSEAAVVIGSGAAQNVSVQLDGASQDYYAGLNNSTGYFEIGSGLTVGSGQLLTLSSTGNLGIGDTTPDGKLDFDLTSTSTTGASEYGANFTISDTGVVTTGTDTTYGVYTSLTRTGATGGTINNYGQYITVTGNTGGTSTNYGLYVSVASADTNYAGIFSGGNVGIGDTTPAALFTVGSGDLFQVDSSGNVTLQNQADLRFGDSDGSNYVAFQSGATVSSNITWTLPTADTSGVWKSNGSGTLSIAAVNLSSDVTGTLGAAYGGTGLDTSASTGIATVSSGTWSIASSLGVTLGGTGTTTQFTQGSIVFAGASGVYSQDNSNFFWDDTNNRLGIGTATPATSLHILGTSNALRLAYDATNYVTLASSSSGSLTIDSSSATEAAFVIGDGSAQDTYFLFDGSAQDYYAGLDDTDDVFKVGLGSAVGTTSYLSITSAGDVGINTDSPSGRFHSKESGAQTAANYAAYLENISTNTTTDAIDKYGLYITSTGDFSGSGGASTNNYGIYLATTSGGDNNYQIYDQSGAYLSTAGTWTNAPSYRRYKEKYTSTESYLDRLMTLDVYEWQYKDETIDGINRYENDPYRHASPFLDDFYNTFKLGTEDGYNIQDLAGVAVASVKELNQRFIDQNQSNAVNFADLTLKTDQNVTTLQELQASIDDQLLLVGNQLVQAEAVIQQIQESEEAMGVKLADYETMLQQIQTENTSRDTLLTSLQTQMETLTQTNQALLDFYTALQLDRLALKDEEGNLDLLDGKLRAAVLEAGGLTIEIVDEERPTLGSIMVYPTAKDEDNDGKDDYTGLSMTNEEVEDRDGKSVFVPTKAITEDSKIFTSFQKNPGAFSWTEKKKKDGEFTGFTLYLSAPVTEVTTADWWIVKEK
jgi:hypothetical protein